MHRTPIDPGEPPRSAEQLLAHALELTHDSIDRYRQLQVALEVHHHLDAASLLGRIVALSLEHATRMGAQGGAEDLPKIAPWHLRWRCPSLISHQPEAAVRTGCEHHLSPRQVLELALMHERCAQRFYLSAAAEAVSSEARQMLETIARLQAHQIRAIEALVAEAASTPSSSTADLDPPERPE
jgi:rubrerythrin